MKIYIESFKKCIKSKINDPYVYYSLYTLLKSVANIKISNISIIDTHYMNVFYCDGSSSRKVNAASYGVVKLLGESTSEDARFDLFTKTNQLFKEYSGKIDDGTNNVGEFNGILTAVKNNGPFQIQIIISDSEYAVKTFREWIYNWKKNNFKTYSNQSISNKDLILNIQNEIENSNKIFLFKWIKGHSGDFFNDYCDQLAKKELGIEK